MKIVRKKVSPSTTYGSTAIRLGMKKDRDLLSRARSRPFYNPKKSDSYLSIAKEYLRLDDDKGAERALYEALKFNGSNSVAHYLLAEINYNRADSRRDFSWREAEGHLITAAKLDPKNPEIWMLYGLLLRQKASEDEYLRDSERIIEYFQMALKLGLRDIDEPPLHYLGRKSEAMRELAYTFKDTKKFADALKIFQKLYQHIRYVGYLREIAICYENLNNHSKANELNLKVFKTKDAFHYPDAFYSVALFAYNNKRFDDALKYTEKLISLEQYETTSNNNKARDAILLSQILFALNNSKRALTIVNTALLDAPQHSVLLLQKCTCLAELERYKEAIELLDLIEDIEKKKPSSTFITPTILAVMRANLLLALEDYHGVIRITSKVLKTHPDSFVTLDVMAKAYNASNQMRKSLKVLQKMQKLRPDDIPILSFIAVYAELGDGKNATLAFEKLLKKNPSLKAPGPLLPTTPMLSVDDKLAILLFGAGMYHEYAKQNAPVKNLKRALYWCNKALKLSQSDRVLADKIHILLHLKRFKDAYETFSKIKSLDSLLGEQEHFGLHLDVMYCNQKLKNPPKDSRKTTVFVKNFTRAMKNPNFKKYFSNYCFNKELHTIVSKLTVRKGMK